MSIAFCHNVRKDEAKSKKERICSLVAFPSMLKRMAQRYISKMSVRFKQIGHFWGFSARVGKLSNKNSRAYAIAPLQHKWHFRVSLILVDSVKHS